MAANTYTALNKVTITGSTTNTMEFASIPSGYTDLRIVFNGQTTAAAITCLKFNNTIAGTDYSYTWIGGGGATATTNLGANQPHAYVTNVGHMNANPGQITIDILQYSNPSMRKHIISTAVNGAGLGVDKTVSKWRQTTAISSIQIFLDRAEYWSIGSTFTLYGIKAEAPAPKATGGAIYTDAEYYYHVFGATGAFVPTQSLTADVLVVAGGGGGGHDDGGAGGAGGLAIHSGRSLSATSYTVTVGAGGTGSVAGSGGGQGANSVFDTITATGGGGGGTGNAAGGRNGGTGGSGGGGSYRAESSSTLDGVPGNGTTGTSGGATLYGNAGGYGYHLPSYGGGGGGGAGTAGVNATSTTGGSGGDGLSNSLITALAIATGIGEIVNGSGYLGGGGGGSVASATGNIAGRGGYGGGGAGKLTGSNGDSGKPNSGGGGGADAGAATVGKGGSGVVIVRYLK